MGKIGKKMLFCVLYHIEKNLSIILVPKIKINQAVMCESYSKKKVWVIRLPLAVYLLWSNHTWSYLNFCLGCFSDIKSNLWHLIQMQDTFGIVNLIHWFAIDNKRLFLFVSAYDSKFTSLVYMLYWRSILITPSLRQSWRSVVYKKQWFRQRT